jgi:hypothetical protein
VFVFDIGFNIFAVSISYENTDIFEG